MKRVRMFTTALSLMFFLTFVVGCGGDVSSSQNASKSSDTTITIGYVGGLSGPTAAFGLPIFESVQYAVEEINKNGGINGKQLNIVKIDDEGNPFKGQQAIDKFSSQGVHFIISGSSSSVALAEVPKVKEHNIIAISPVATDPSVPSPDSNFFVNITNNNDFGHAIAYYASKLGVKEVISFVRDDAYGKSIEKAFKEKAESLGIKVDKEISYPIDTQDFNSYITQGLKDYPNSFIVLTGYAADSGVIAKQARALGYNKAFLATNPITNVQYKQIAGNASDNTVIATAYFGEGENASTKTRQFIVAWSSAKGGFPPNVYQVHGYDAVYMLKKAIEDAGSTDPTAVRKALEETKNYDGVSGKMTFNNDGSVTKTMYIVKWEAGKLQLLEVLGPGTY